MIWREHVLYKHIQILGNKWVKLAHGREDETLREIKGITSGQTTVHRRSKRIQVGARTGLRTAVLFGRRISRRPKQHCILLLPLFEEARDTKIDQEQPPILTNHHIGRLQITKDDWRLLRV